MNEHHICKWSSYCPECEVERLTAENRRLREAIGYVKECWLETSDQAKWGNALPALFESVSSQQSPKPCPHPACFGDNTVDCKHYQCPQREKT